MSDCQEKYVKMLKHIAEIYGQLRKLEDDLLKFVFEHDPEKHPEDQYHKNNDCRVE